MREIIEDLISIDGVLGCYIIDREGSIVDYKGGKNTDENLISAMVAEISNELANQMKIPDNFTISAMANSGRIFMIAKKDFILALLTTTEVDTGEVRLKLRRCSKLIAESL